MNLCDCLSSTFRHQKTERFVFFHRLQLQLKLSTPKLD
ncbi:MAG: hypothetical protein ACW9XA_05590 [Candidatus Nitrosopumilus sp. bin_6a]